MTKTPSLFAFVPVLLLLVARDGFTQPLLARLAGERLVFSAEFLHMELGWLQFEMLKPVDTLGTSLWRSRVTIQSNPRLALVRAHFVFESYFDEEFNSYLFTAQERRANGLDRSVCRFDRSTSLVHVHEWREIRGRRVDERTSTHLLLPGLRDGIALFYFLRAAADGWDLDPKTLYVLSGQRPDSVFIRRGPPAKLSSGQLAALHLAKLESDVTPIACRLAFTGIAGLRREILSFFSTDGLALPLRTELQVYLGKVQMRLVEQDHLPIELTAQNNSPLINSPEIMKGVPR